MKRKNIADRRFNRAAARIDRSQSKLNLHFKTIKEAPIKSAVRGELVEP